MTLVHGRADQMPLGHVRAWLYGDTGSGKTVAAASFPQPYFVLPKNEDSIKTLRGASCGYTTIVPDSENIRGEIQGFVEMLLSLHPQELYARFGQTLVLDAFTHVVDMLIHEVAQQRVTRGEEPGQMHQQKWGLLRTYLLNLRDLLWRLPMHVVFVSLSYATTNPKGDLVRGGVRGGGSALDLLPSSCDVLGYCEAQAGGKYVVNFSQVSVFPARTRFWGMPTGPYPNQQLWAAIAPFLGYGR